MAGHSIFYGLEEKILTSKESLTRVTGEKLVEKCIRCLVKLNLVLVSLTLIFQSAILTLPGANDLEFTVGVVIVCVRSVIVVILCLQLSASSESVSPCRKIWRSCMLFIIHGAISGAIFYALAWCTEELANCNLHLHRDPFKWILLGTWFTILLFDIYIGLASAMVALGHIGLLLLHVREVFLKQNYETTKRGNLIP